MDQILDQLSRLRGIGGTVLLSPDGLPMASRLRSDVDEDGFAAVVADLLSQARALCERMSLGNAGMLHAQSEEGGLVLMAAGPCYLAIIIDPNANLALLQLETRPFVDAIAKQLAI